MLKKFQNAFNRVKLDPVDGQTEYIQYAQDVECTLRQLEQHLHVSDNPEEIAMGTLKTACEFYQGNWAGILVVDFDLHIWTLLWWYNTCSNDKTDVLLEEFESSEYMHSWGDAMYENHSLIVTDVEEIKNLYPEEYGLYKRLDVQSVIGVPFKPRPTGFLVVRNPQRYKNRCSMLQMLAVVGLIAVNEKNFLDSAKMAISPDAIKNDKDVIINVFGSLEIYTSKGVLHEDDLKSPKICRLLIYMLMNQRTSHPPREIADVIWPEGETDQDALCSNLRGLVYRFRQTFSLISDYPLIESTSNGYRLNPDFHIMSDMQNFDKVWTAIQNTSGTIQKVELLKKAFTIYRGQMHLPAFGEFWMSSTATHYSLRYLGLVNELLSKMAEAEDYAGISHYATRALTIMPENIKAHFWMIYSMYRSGAVEMAKSEVERAKTYLTEEEYQELERMLKEIE